MLWCRARGSGGDPTRICIEYTKVVSGLRLIDRHTISSDIDVIVFASHQPSIGVEEALESDYSKG